MSVALLSIGTELTRGELINSNAAWLAEQVTGLGFEIVEHCTVDDDDARIIAALRRLAGEVKAVICTGGLGPTSDDRTTAAVASALGVGLWRHAPSLETIRQRWTARRGEQPLPSVNEKQADFPEGAEILENKAGTAPGFAVQLGGARCFFLPGVPMEMQPMFAGGVAPKLAAQAPRTTHQLHLRTFGWPESQVAQALQPLETSAAVKAGHLRLGYRAHFPEIEVKVWGSGDSPEAAIARAEAGTREAKALLGAIVFGERHDSLAGVVGQALRQRGLRLAVAESCTGGLVGKLLTDVPGSSDYLVLDTVTYANTAKTRVLEVPGSLLQAHGAVSADVAQAMAEGVLRLGEADLAISITGIAGPGGGTTDKPVGTLWLALAARAADGSPALVHLQHHHLPWDRPRFRTLAAHLALDLLRRHLLDLPLPATADALYTRSGSKA